MAIYAAPTVGRLGILTKEACFNQAAVGCVSDPEIFGYEYLFLALQSKRDLINSLSNGAAQQNISVQIVKELMILCAPKYLNDSFKKIIKDLFNIIKGNLDEIEILSLKKNILQENLISGNLIIKCQI